LRSVALSCNWVRGAPGRHWQDASGTRTTLAGCQWHPDDTGRMPVAPGPHGRMPVAPGRHWQDASGTQTALAGCQWHPDRTAGCQWHPSPSSRAEERVVAFVADEPLDV
jgi:hypothetical protein